MILATHTRSCKMNPIVAHICQILHLLYMKPKFNFNNISQRTTYFTRSSYLPYNLDHISTYNIDL
jgi:hypothetical protein